MRTYSEQNFFKGKASSFENQGKPVSALAQLYLTEINENGDFEFSQGFSDMPGEIKKEAIDLYINRFDYLSRHKIYEHLEKEK